MMLVNESVKPLDFDKRVKRLVADIDFTNNTIENYIVIDNTKHYLSDDIDILKIELSDIRDIYCM